MQQYCDLCGAPVYEEDYYQEYDMCICPNCFSAFIEELMWIDG
jgi:recombinational DNA repair protein (RecF pathway)